MHSMFQPVFNTRIAFALLLSLGISVSAYAGGATDTVTHLQTALIESMKKGDRLSYQDRVKQLSSIIDHAHDFPLISKVVMGQYWSTLSSEEQTAFIHIFKDLSVSMYANRFNSFGGEAFTVISEKDMPRGKRKLVDTRFAKSDGEEVRFLYMLQQTADQWKILNITVNGVSDLALKRAEYGGILKKDNGFQELLRTLQSQIDKNANGQ